MKPKLLVVELWAVGDVLIAAPFLRAACEKFSVTLLAKPHAQEFQSRFFPDVDIVSFVAPWTAFRFRRKYGVHAWPWFEIFRLRTLLRRGRFDVGLSSRWDPRDHVLLALAGVRRRLGFPRVGSRVFLNEPLERPVNGAHSYEHWRVLGNALGIALPERASIALPPPRPGCILIHTGAAQRVRVWPLERFRGVARRLRELGFVVQVACDANQRDWWLAVGETDVATPRTLTDLAGLTDRAAIFIGNDSGPGHVAAFSGVPTFTIFGPQLPERFAPVHPSSAWIEGRPCRYRPCSDYCRFSVPHCIWEIREEMAWPRIHQFVAQHAGLIDKVAGATAPRSSVAAGQNAASSVGGLRVLYVNNSADIYGGSRMLLRFVITTDRGRLQPLVVLPEEGLLKDSFEAQAVEVVLHRRLSVITRPVFHSWRIIVFLLNFPASVFFLWRLIRKWRIDLVYTNTGVTISAALAAKLAGVPHVWHIREWFQEFRSFWPAYARYVKMLSRKVVAVSNAVAGQFEPPGTAVVIHDGFALEEFQVPRQILSEKFRAKYGLGEHFVVGCVGRIKYVRKGQEILVQATAILKKRGRPIKALIVGAPFPGNEIHLTQLQNLVRELDVQDCVVLTGELPDVRPAYASMSILALTSAQPEPFGGVVMEAMAMKLPVIATNIGGSVDQVVEGVTGLLIPPGEPLVLADAIEKLMNDPELCRRMGRAAVQRIGQNFTLAEMTLKMTRLFEAVIAEHRNGS